MKTMAPRNSIIFSAYTTMPVLRPSGSDFTSFVKAAAQYVPAGGGGKTSKSGGVSVALPGLGAVVRTSQVGALASPTTSAVIINGITAPAGGGGPPPLPFLPTSIGSAKLWLDANDPNGTGAVPSDGQAVTTWVNKTTGVPNLTGSAAISKYQGRNSVNFPNTNSLYTTSGSVPVSSITFFMVWLQALIGSNGGGFNFGTNPITWQSDGIGFYSDAGGSKPGGSQGFRVYSGPTTVTGSGYITATSTDAVPLNLFSVTIDTAGNITIYKNGTVFQTATRAAGWGGNFNICGFGEDFRYGNPATGVTALQYISEILVYNKVLSTAERQKVEGYLTWKWGLQSTLPAGHLYETAAPTA